MGRQAFTALEQLGFSAYEARVYLGLVKQNPITGYQLSKMSGVPRSRIYETLERLTAKGYAVKLRKEPAEYRPLAVRELLGHLQEQFDGNLSALETELKKVSTAPEAESIWNLRGREDILRRAQTMISRAKESVYLVGWGEVPPGIAPGTGSRRGPEHSDRRDQLRGGCAADRQALSPCL